MSIKPNILGPLNVHHPLVGLVTYYLDEYDQLRDEYRHLSNLEFHRTYGLRVDGPLTWPYPDVIKEMGGLVHGLTIIYSNVKVYEQCRDALKEKERRESVGYMSYYELKDAIHEADRDHRLLDRFKDMLRESKVVLFMGASVARPEVLDQIRHLTDHCLILVG